MKRIVRLLVMTSIIVGAICGTVYADTTISGLPAGTSMSDDDLLLKVEAPDGVAETQKITWGNFRSVFLSNSAYDSTGWNGVTNQCPSLDVIRDYFESLFPSGSDGTYGLVQNNNTSRDPTASAYEEYFEGGVFKVNQNGTEYAVCVAPSAGQLIFSGSTAPRTKTVRDVNDTLLELGGAYAPTGAWDFGGATSLEVPNGTSPTVDAAGEVGVDTTSDQFRYYGSAERVLSYKKTFSVVVPSVADTDDMWIMKAPYGMTLTAIDCIVSAATSATINIQECGSDGTSCSDTATSDLACDTDGANTTSFSNATIDSGDWIRLDVASLSGTPGTLTVTATYSIVAD